jgi:flagellar motor component MotA
MAELSKKEFIAAAIVGTVLGVLCGVAVGLSMFREAKRCDTVKQENRVLREMVTFYQNQPPCGE